MLYWMLGVVLFSPTYSKSQSYWRKRLVHVAVNKGESSRTRPSHGMVALK